MLNNIKDLIKTILEKVKTWKHVVLIITTIIVILFSQIILKMNITDLLNSARSDITSDVADEIINKREILVANTIAMSPVVDSLINSTLDYINNKFSFGRSIIWVYHDNITMANGIPYSRMSMSHERILESKIKINSQINMMQNIPISIFTQINKLLFTNGYICYNIKDIKTIDQNTYYRYLEEHVTGHVAYLIRDDSNKPLAVIMSFSYEEKILCNRELYIYFKTQGDIIKNLLKYNNENR